MTRWQAAGIHLALSATIAAVVLFVMLGVWYPHPLFEAEGGPGLVFIVVGVDVVLGPLITLVIFRSGKPGLRFDLWMIALLQSAALLYGVHVVAEVRPAYIAFVKGQFEVVGAIDIDPADLARAKRPEFRRLPLGGPVLVAVDAPADPQSRQKLLALALERGKDMRQFPEFYVPYEDYRLKALATGRTLEKVRESEPEMARAVERYLAESGRPAADVRYYPFRASRAWGAAIVDAKSGELLALRLPEQ